MATITSTLHHLGTEGIFPNFEIIASRRDPQVDGVYLLQIRFKDTKEYGLCIYNTITKEYVEEPTTYTDCDVTQVEMSRKYGFDHDPAPRNFTKQDIDFLNELTAYLEELLYKPLPYVIKGLKSSGKGYSNRKMPTSYMVKFDNKLRRIYKWMNEGSKGYFLLDGNQIIINLKN